MRERSPWDWAAWGLIAVHTALLISWWPVLPWFVDVYYHLNVLEGFRQAGGVVLHDFWEFAPGGRPHLYPPALHVALLSFDWLSVDLITRARLAAIVPYPALLLTAWWFARCWLGRAPAYWATVAGVLPFSYMLVTCNTIAATWAMVWWLVGLVAVARGALLAGGLAVALVCYTHLGTPWLLLVCWIVLAVMDRALRRPLLISAAVGLALASPWWLHVWTHRALLRPLATFENQLLELPIALYALAAIGVAAGRAAPPAGRRVAISVLAGLLPLVMHYRFRFFSGQGLLGAGLLAGMGAHALQQWLERRIASRRVVPPWVVPAVLTCALAAVHPVVFVQRGAGPVVFGDTSLSNLLSWGERVDRSNAVTFYYPHLMDPLVEIIKQQTRADELIGSNMAATAGMLSALSGRATATGMLSEVRSARDTALAALRQAHVIVWLKGGAAPGLPPLAEVQRAWRLSLVAETELAYVLRNPQAGAGRTVTPVAVPLWVAQLLLWSAVVAIGAGLVRRGGLR